jgi:hypothetical protein
MGSVYYSFFSLFLAAYYRVIGVGPSCGWVSGTASEFVDFGQIGITHKSVTIGEHGLDGVSMPTRSAGLSQRSVKNLKCAWKLAGTRFGLQERGVVSAAINGRKIAFRRGRLAVTATGLERQVGTLRRTYRAAISRNLEDGRNGKGNVAN